MPHDARESTRPLKSNSKVASSVSQSSLQHCSRLHQRSQSPHIFIKQPLSVLPVLLSSFPAAPRSEQNDDPSNESRPPSPRRHGHLFPTASSASPARTRPGTASRGLRPGARTCGTGRRSSGSPTRRGRPRTYRFVHAARKSKSRPRRRPTPWPGSLRGRMPGAGRRQRSVPIPSNHRSTASSSRRRKRQRQGSHQGSGRVARPFKKFESRLVPARARFFMHRISHRRKLQLATNEY